MLLGRGLVVNGADRLGGIGERGIVGWNHGACHDDRHLAMAATLQKRVVEGLGEQIADLALRLRAKHVERRRRNYGSGHLGPDGQKADLRSVAVSDDDFGATPLRQRYKAARRGHEVVPLDFGGAGFTPSDQGVAAEGNRQPGHRMILRIIL